MMNSSSKLVNKFGNKLADFKKDTSGNLAIIAAVSLMPMLIVVGAAIDYSRVYLTSSTITTALDAAVLSAAKGLSSGALSNEQLESHINAMVSANLVGVGMSGVNYTVINIDNNTTDGTLSAGIQVELPMVVMSIGDISTKTVSSSVQVTYGNQRVEVAMMLDVTGSMYGSKIAALKTAAKDAVKILVPANVQDEMKVRVGLVPYSYSINAGSFANDVTDDESDRCVTERGGDEAYSDADPVTYPVGADPRAVDDDYCPSKSVRPLSSQRSDLLNDINAYSAGGYTAGHLGIAWSYYMLSPSWNGIWPTAADAGSYSDNKILKVAILMTDGIFNTYYEGTTGTAWGGNATPSNYAATRLCEDMRDKGIVVYSIAFEAPQAAQEVLQTCATPSENDVQYYYNAESGEQLKQAFKDIANSIKTLRISQ